MGSIIKISVPTWVQQQPEVQKQRTIIPASQLTGIQSPAQQRQASMQAPQQDSVPAMLRPGEEVVTPETVDAMGGRGQFIGAMNDKLKPTGLQLNGGQGPVQGGQPENKFARGTTGELRQGFAKGTAQINMTPSYIPGGISTNYKSGAQGLALQQMPRKGYSGGTQGATTSITPSKVVQPAPSASTPAPSASTPAPSASTPAPSASTPAPSASTAGSSMPTGINIDNATRGLGLTASTQNPTQSAYYKTAATTADQNLQKQGSVAAMIANQNMAQSGVKQGSAQANTMQAQQNAQTASNIATTNTGIAQTAEAQMQSDLSNKMSLAMQAGNYGAVNQALVDQGQKPIDFTKVETQQQEGNLAQASTALNNIISSLDPADVATKTALTQQKATIDLQVAQALTGTKFDPAITAAAASKAFTSETDKLTNAFVGQAVAGAVNLLTTTTDGMNSVALMQSNPVGSALLTKAESGDPDAMKEFGTLTIAINAWNTTKQIGGTPMPYAQIQDLVNHGAIAMTQADLDKIQAEYDTPMKGSLADEQARDAEILKTTGVPRKPSLQTQPANTRSGRGWDGN